MRDRWLALVIAVAFSTRLAAQVAYGTYADPDTFEYDSIARGLVRGEGYHHEFFGADWLTFGFPAFPFLLAVLHAAGGGPDSYLLIGLAMATLSAALTVPAYLIATMLVDRAAGIFAATAVALNPPLILYAARVHELNLDALLLASMVVASFGLARSPDMASGIRYGSIAGIAAYARPTVAVFAAIALAALSIRGPRRPLVVAVGIALLIALPWTIRHSLLLDGVAPSAPHSCVTLWMGNNPYATGGPLTADGRSVFAAMPDTLRARLVGQPEHVQGRIFCEEAARFLQTSLVGGMLWWAEKFAYFWWFPPHAGLYYPPAWIEAYRFAYAIELALVIVGTGVTWRRGWRLGLGLVALELIVISGAQAVGYVEGRHRLVLEASLAALAAIGFVAIAKLTRRGTRPKGQSSSSRPAALSA